MLSILRHNALGEYSLSEIRLLYHSRCMRIEELALSCIYSVYIHMYSYSWFSCATSFCEGTSARLCHAISLSICIMQGIIIYYLMKYVWFYDPIWEIELHTTLEPMYAFKFLIWLIIHALVSFHILQDFGVHLIFSILSHDFLYAQKTEMY